MNTITITTENAQILLDLAQDMIRNRMAVHQVTPEIQAAVQELVSGLAAEVAVVEEVVEAAPVEAPVADTPVEEPVADTPSE